MMLSHIYCPPPNALPMQVEFAHDRLGSDGESQVTKLKIARSMSLLSAIPLLVPVSSFPLEIRI